MLPNAFPDAGRLDGQDLESSKGKEGPMEFFLPSILLIIFAIGLSVAFVPRLSPFVLVLGSVMCIAIAGYNHYTLFSGEYSVMSWIEGAKGFAPILLTILVILLAGGYLLMMIGGGKTPTLQMPSMTIPPPETATNMLTQNIGEGLKNAGMPVSGSRNRGENFGNRNRYNENSLNASLLSKHI